MLKQLPKIGDKVRYIGEDQRGIKHGGIYELKEFHDFNGAYITDDDGRTREITESRFDKWELISEGTSVEASPSVIELLSNLALRLTKVEAGLEPKEADEVDNETPTQSDTVDNVNSPQHYRHGRFETIELIEDITKKYDDGFVAYCVGNAVKYVDRAPFKHGSPSEDLRKAAWYLTRAAEHTDATTPPST